MAYSKASRIVGRAERLLGAPLTQRRIGGSDGGGSTLTPLARELIARYETFRADCETAVAASFARGFGDFLRTVPVPAGESVHSPRTDANHPISSENVSHTADEPYTAMVDGNAPRDSESSRAATSREERALGHSLSVSASANMEVKQGASSEDRCPDKSPSLALGCVVLAAGQARRFGGGKLLAELEGRPMLARTLGALPRECFCRAVAVTSDPAVSTLCRALGFPVREYPGGALSDSIREGLAEMDGTGGCMFVNADQPLLRSASLRRMAAAFADAPNCAFRLAHGGVAASPTIFPASGYPALRGLTGEQGGMTVMRTGVMEVQTVEADDPSELWDVDDEAALRRVKTRLAKLRGE